MSRYSTNRRVGRRHPIRAVPITWRADLPPPTGFRKRRRTGPLSAHMVDLSVSGAAIVAPPASDLGVGSKVLIDFEGHPGRVLIRRVAPGPVASAGSLYGVEFAEPNGELTSALYDLFIRHTSGVPDWHDPRSSGMLGQG
ncbi:hypothetical protein BH20ACT3_BH20ACT3_01810 [soil metagenome]